MRSIGLALAWVTLTVVLVVGPGTAKPGTDDPGVLTMGDVRFPHELHYAEIDIECSTCHHETSAAALVVPHEEYFTDFWINCRTCHGAATSDSRSCSSCHHASPADLADETLSAKVVIHRSCWSCHEIGTGPEASRGCKTCHRPATGLPEGGRNG